MIRLVVILFFSTIVFSVFSQNFSQDFGNISIEELKLQKYAKDASAEALVIYDIGKSFIEFGYNGANLFFERRFKVKIFNKAGYNWAQISIPFYIKDYKAEEIKEILATTYNYENGAIKKTDLDIKNIFDVKQSENWFDKTFAMPDIKDGSVIEVSYKIKSPYLFNLWSWDFQKEIPVLYTKYTVSMNPFYEYITTMSGNHNPVTTTTTDSELKHLNAIAYRETIYSFKLENVKAFNNESFITTKNDYISRINFQLAAIHNPDGFTKELITTWPKLIEELISDESFGGYLKACKGKAKVFTDTMQIASKSKIEIAKSIERFVKTNYSWNGNNGKYSTMSVKDFMKTRTGNSADINLFLAGMLASAGIEVYPVILSTRSNGKITLDYPFFKFFNYVVVLAKIDSATFLLDATEPLSNFNEIPTQCINDKGLIIQKKKVEWTMLSNNSLSTVERKFILRCNSDLDSINESCQITSTGYEALNFRKKYSTSYDKLKSLILGINSLPGDSLLQNNLNNTDKSFEIMYGFTSSIEVIEDKLIISPFSTSLLTENPLKQTSRDYPVDMTYKTCNLFESTIMLPDGYKLLKKPEDLFINDKIINISYKTVNSDDSIKVTGVYEFKKDIYGVSDYYDLKKYFNTIVSKFNEKFILIKKE